MIKYIMMVICVLVIVGCAKHYTRDDMKYMMQVSSTIGYINAKRGVPIAEMRKNLDTCFDKAYND